MQKPAPMLPSNASSPAQAAAFRVVVALSVCHLLNDMMQSLLPAIYPIIKSSYHLDFGQIGLITLAFQLTASMLQPMIGVITDRYPQPFSLVAGMGSTLCGLLVLANSASYQMLLLGAALLGTGSAIFHPESTRIARAASGGRHGLAQSIFQVGGQVGQSVGPLLAAFIVVPRGQGSLAWFSAAALVAMMLMFGVGRWYRARMPQPVAPGSVAAARPRADGASVAVIAAALVMLTLSKSAYTASLSTYYTFYLIEQFGVTVQASQVLLFVFLLAQALGSLIGGHIGDRIGRRAIIWFSILGALPFTLLLPHVGLAATAVLSVVIAMIMASAFPAIVVYGMELFPGKVGMVAGMFFGLSFGLGALSAAVLGGLADATSLTTVYNVCALLPLLGLCAWVLPDLERGTARAR